MVTVSSNSCADEPKCVPQCAASECVYLCRHQIYCTCWDYLAGHLCKHCHKVKAIMAAITSDQLEVDDRTSALHIQPMTFMTPPVIKEDSGKYVMDDVYSVY